MMCLDRLRLFCGWLSASVVLLMGLGYPQLLLAGAVQDTQYVITSVKVERAANAFQVVIEGQSPPAYTMYELVDPLRVVLDVADARFGEQLASPADLPQGPIREVKFAPITNQKTPVARIEILLVDEPAYTVARQGNNIVVNFPSVAAAHTPPQKIASPVSIHPERSGQAASRLTEIVVNTQNPSETLVYLKTDGPVSSYQKAQLAKGGGNPARMYIDIPNVRLPGKGIRKAVGTSLARIRAAQREKAVRVVFDSGLDKVFSYEVESQPDGLLVRIAESSGAAAPILADLVKEKGTGTGPGQPKSYERQRLQPAASTPRPSETIVPKFTTVSPQAKAKPVQPQPPKEASSAAPKKAAAPVAGGLAGYSKQRITVDFFKIDLHNVFRLFGEISGQNIVVDEGVSGTLTLALNDVPWDFALDIILNLKDLQKEERYNTIVIAPKKKELNWPRAAVESNVVGNKETILEKPDPALIAQQLKVRKEELEAKSYIKKAQDGEKAGQYEQAMTDYETAFGLWPDNMQLANHLASLCLVQLGMPAKGVRYAKEVLDHDPANGEAALLAAIGSAHMQDITAAKQYFDMAIAGPKPPSAALISYAAFAEEQQSYNGALSLLQKHSQLYGETLDTLVSQARILDKQGESTKADAVYNKIRLSGYDLPEELRRYIQGRIMVGN